jgi:hypothetical protein
MEHTRQVAFETVLRACGFGSLAIFCMMIGLSFEPCAAFQAGGPTAGESQSRCGEPVDESLPSEAQVP